MDDFESDEKLQHEFIKKGQINNVCRSRYFLQFSNILQNIIPYCHKGFLQYEFNELTITYIQYHIYVEYEINY